MSFTWPWPKRAKQVYISLPQEKEQQRPFEEETKFDLFQSQIARRFYALVIIINIVFLGIAAIGLQHSSRTFDQTRLARSPTPECLSNISIIVSRCKAERSSPTREQIFRLGPRMHGASFNGK